MSKTKPIGEPNQLLFGGMCPVPKTVADCPECGAKLMAHSQAWCEKTGRPIDCDLDINCVRDIHFARHRYWQSDWQPVVDAVRKWAGAISPDEYLVE